MVKLSLLFYRIDQNGEYISFNKLQVDCDKKKKKKKLQVA